MSKTHDISTRDSGEPIGDDADEQQAALVNQDLTEQEAGEDEERRAAVAGWAYLAVLFAIFGGIALWAFTSEDEPLAAPVVADAGQSDGDSSGDAALTPTELIYTVDNESVTLAGNVPDDATRSGLVELAEGRYTEVTDQLNIDNSSTLSGGTISVVGRAVEGDADPEGLQNDAVAAYGLSVGDREVEFTPLDVPSVQAEVAIATDQVTLSGAFPDEASRDQFTVASQNIFGADNVDASGLSLDPETTLTASSVTITGILDAGDTRGAQLEDELQQFFSGTTVDRSGLAVDTSAEALGRLEVRLAAELEANPILFESGSSDINDFAENVEILQAAADAINAAPGIPVEIVGHTDSSGNAGVNQVLSEERAEAVMNRLIELGVDAARLDFRGAGATEPVADNETDEGKARNRRIEFKFAGSDAEADAATEAGADGETTDTTTDETSTDETEG